MKFATEKHKGQTRIGGEEYITHPIAVAELVKEKGLSEDTITTALFHDLLEDTDATKVEIMGYSNEDVLRAVKLLTKLPGYDMETYINGISGDSMALNVKLADRVHNLKSALDTNERFKRRYIAETEEWYVPLSENTLFEEDIKTNLEKLKTHLY